MRNSSGIPQGKLKAKFNTGLTGVGWLRGGIYVSNNEDLMTGGDTNGVYVVAHGKPKFTDLLNTSTLPSSAYLGVTDHTADGTIWGCQVCAMYPADGNIGIFVFNNSLYKSTNMLSSSPTATKLSGPYPNAYFSSNTNGSFAWRKAEFDPQNSSVFLIGTQSNVLLYSTDGGTTVNTLAVDTPGAYQGATCYHAVACDPSSTIVGGVHQVWYYSTYGVGVKKSTTGPGGPYTLVTGSPTNVNSFKVAANGDVYAINGGESSGGNLYKKTAAGSSFSKCTGLPNGQLWDVAINPQNTNKVIATVSQQMSFVHSLDGGSTWIGNDFWQNGNPPIPQGAMPLIPLNASWMMKRDSNGKTTTKPQGDFGGQSGNIEWNAAGDTLYCATGQGLLKCVNPPTVFNTTLAAQWKWQEVSLGISQAVCADPFTPIGGATTIWPCGDFGIMVGNSADNTTSQVPQKTVMNNHFDQTAWSVEQAPAPNQNFLVAQVGFMDSVHSYSTDYGQNWTPFSGNFQRNDIVMGAGVTLAQTPTDLYAWFVSNNRPESSHNGGATWNYEDVNMPGMITKGRAWAGSGNGIMIFTDVNDWTGVQNYTVIVNAPSGGGSVSVVGSTITVTPAAGAASCAAVAAQVNGNGAAAAKVTASYGGDGSGAVTTGTYNVNYFYSGWGFQGIGYNEPMRCACLDKTNGDIYCYNFGDEVFGGAAPWAGIWKRTASTGLWTRVSSSPGGISAVTQPHIREVLGKTGHIFFHGERDTPLYRTTDGVAGGISSWSIVGDGAGHNFSNVLWAHTGKAAPGQTYPAIYVAGTLNGTTALYACFDGSWTNWQQYSPIQIGGYVYDLFRFCADPNVFGKIDGCWYQGAWTGVYDEPLTVT